jgi:class 3 adenylate cyclase
LFTDIVGSTERLAVIGDLRWREILIRHEGQILQCVDDQGGRLVKMLGDGSLSVFAGPVAAVRAGRSICEAATRLDIEVRAGVHAGECERHPSGDISGLAVHIAAHVGATAGAGEVLISRPVRDLIGASGLLLAPRGHHKLKGLSDLWELFTVLGEAVPRALCAPQHL